eukprot:426311_1
MAKSYHKLMICLLTMGNQMCGQDLGAPNGSFVQLHRPHGVVPVGVTGVVTGQGTHPDYVIVRFDDKSLNRPVRFLLTEGEAGEEGEGEVCGYAVLRSSLIVLQRPVEFCIPVNVEFATEADKKRLSDKLEDGMHKAAVRGPTVEITDISMKNGALTACVQVTGDGASEIADKIERDVTATARLRIA